MRRVQILALLLMTPSLAAQQQAVTAIPAQIEQIETLTDAGNPLQAIRLAEPLLQRLIASGKPAEDLGLTHLRFQYGIALRDLRRTSEAEQQFRLIASTFGGSKDYELIRDVDFEIAKISSLDGRLPDARLAIQGALLAERRLPAPDDLLASLLVLATQIETRMGNDAGALAYALEAQALPEPADKTHSVHSQLLSALIVIYMHTGDDARIRALLPHLHASASTPDEQFNADQTQLQVDARSLQSDGRFAQAIAKNARAIQSLHARFSDVDPNTDASNLQSVAELTFLSGDVLGAAQAYKRAIDAYRSIFSNHFISMTEAEKHQFVAELQPLAAEFYSFCLLHPEYADQAYRFALWQKNIVSDSMLAAHLRQQGSTDPVAASLSANLEQLRRQWMQLTGIPGTDPAKVFALQTQIDAADRALAVQLASRGFGTGVTLEAVRAALPPLDAAVEVVSFERFDMDGSTGRFVYAAILLKPGSTHASTMIFIGDSLDVDDVQSELSILITRKGKGAVTAVVSHGSLPWQAIEKDVRSARHIYLSPAGVLNTTAFLAWKDIDGRYLVDHPEIDLRPVFSTGELAGLVRPRNHNGAFLIGNPDFNAAASTPPPSGGPAAPIDQSGLVNAVGDTAESLPATAGELSRVAESLRAGGFNVGPPLEGAQASRQALLAVAHPAILHIATHGFFYPADESGAEMNPMGLEMSLRTSALLFAGANRTLRGLSTPTDTDTGILTALEAGSLDLQGTQLVVLSACETGLGQNGVSGEVLGLRRAFHIAGSQRVMVSMWSVNDGATADLMAGFYRNWLTEKMDPYAALRKAAADIKRDHPDPYFWAPFVLFGP